MTELGRGRVVEAVARAGVVEWGWWGGVEVAPTGPAPQEEGDEGERNHGTWMKGEKGMVAPAARATEHHDQDPRRMRRCRAAGGGSLSRRGRSSKRPFSWPRGVADMAVSSRP